MVIMRIVLVHPAGSNWIPGRRDVSAIANRMAPIGILSMASFLAEKGHETFVYDCYGPHARSGVSNTVDEILSARPDMVGFSTTTSSFPDGYEIAAFLKEKAPDIKILFGGAHISAMGDLLMNDYPLIDMMCIGEGELTVSELADGTPLDLINGLVYRENGKIKKNPARSYIKNLDDLPFPDYGKLKGFPGQYHLPLFSYIQKPGATMITSRGCPYQCSFCDRSVFQNRFRSNSAEYVYQHILYLNKNYSVRHINIYDDLFTTQRKRISELCEMLINKRLKMNFNCIVRAGHIDDELLGLLKRAGFLQLNIGIESGDPELLESNKPGVRIEEIRRDIKKIQAHGLRAKGLFIMGLPGETEASIKKTSDFILSLGLDDMNMSKFSPFYGAPIWKNLSEFGTLDNDWKKMNCMNFVFIPKAIASKERLDELYNAHVKRFYSDPEWRKKFRKRIWEHRHSLLYMIKHLPAMISAKRTFNTHLKTDGER